MQIVDRNTKICIDERINLTGCVLDMETSKAAFMIWPVSAVRLSSSVVVMVDVLWV